jgi:uncharacterized protein
MKGVYHPRNELSLNESGNPSIRDVIDQTDVSRRRFVQGSVGSVALTAAGGLTMSGLVQSVQAAPVPPSLGFPGIGFESVPAAVRPAPDVLTHDAVIVPPGYSAKLFVAWGDPIVSGGAAFLADASQTAADQARQYGHHTDGMHFFPFAGVGGQPASDRGVLCANNEYTDEELIHPDGLIGTSGYSIAKCRKSQAAHGVSILEARRSNGAWRVVSASPYGRRLTVNTPMRVSGPAAGHPLMRANVYTITDSGSVPTGAQSDGARAVGTLNNCAHGVTPWGTYLTCEENWNGYFGSNSPATDTNFAGTVQPNGSTVYTPNRNTDSGKNYNRYGISTSGFGYRWHTVDPRFDVSVNPNEPNLFGWVVEIDPYAPGAQAVKRTALGRFKHESAQYVVDSANKVAFYMGDDERNEYIYKFVCAGVFNPSNRAANRDLLDSGVLYVAKFAANGTGEWVALLPGTIGANGVALRDNPNFSGGSDADVLARILIKARMAADAVGATMMDRPEWTGARPRINGFEEIEVYCTLTNNNRRGSSATPSSNSADGSTTAGSARPAVDAANPRANNIYGHIIRWRENGRSVAATTFIWDLFVQCGDTRTTRTPAAQYVGNIADTPDGSADYGAPDGLWFDPFGRLWVQTDQQGDARGDWVNIGANVMVCADPNTGQTRRFMTSPPNCEVTGVTMTPDGRTMFVGIQHPGEDTTAANPTQFSNWPASQWTVRADGVTPLPGGRPRSAVVVITKDDGGVIGS